MTSRKILNLLTLVAMLASVLLMGRVSPASAQNQPDPGSTANAPTVSMPTSPTDETKVPHYFGPYSNWANSPYTLSDVAVQIADVAGGTGTGATATATVGGDGAVTGITLTSPGSGYTAATVTISGAGTGATANALVSSTGVVTAIGVTGGGAGYTKPAVTITGGGATTAATATAYGGVDGVILTNPGSVYTMPTVDFDMPDDPNGTIAKAHAVIDPATGLISSIAIDNPGSGYASAPNVVIRDGTVFSPLTLSGARTRASASSAKTPVNGPRQVTGGTGATATATVYVSSITVNTFGVGYMSAPTVEIADATGTGGGATATATTNVGAVTAINLTAGGTGYVTQGGIKKFQDGLPQLCLPAAGQTFASCANNNLGQHIPVAVPDTTTFTQAGGFSADADYYVIALVQNRERMNSSLPATGTLMRQYVQLETPANAAFSKHVALTNDLLDPLAAPVPALMPDGTQAYAVDDPHMLGPIISATKDKPVRIVFYNLLPTGSAGDLFLPVDSSMMGSGMGPMAMMAPADQGTVTDMVRNPACTANPKSADCFKDNRATIHLHGGNSPWISDGTPHQWITPANETTPWPEGVTVESVPDMGGVTGVPSCTGATDGCMTFYYTNQQSARLLFYHDHSWGITRLNVYAGEAAGYLITDDTEKKLIVDGTIPGALDTIPLIVQDRTFVPQGDPATRTGQLYEQDPTWDASRWGGYGDLWYHHVYMPAQNPGDPTGMSAYGRWMYGPWFWPPAGTAAHGPIANPYYNMDPATNFTTPLTVPCSLDNPATWQYQTDPFCEPQWMPGTPNISVGMEQFNDTPIVNGTAYPTTTLEPKAYRFRILNAANDRFFNFQWYVADSTTASTSLNAAGLPIGGTEVALKPAELAAAQTDPNVFPTPDTTRSPAGPSWIQIGTEGGFLPAPAVVPNQPITWITDPTRFDVGNVDLHSLLLAPAERADVIVDFSAYAGQTLILYNDAPAAFPARVASYDYYTGAPDLSPAGAPSILPGYGPNTRTIMQVKIAGPVAPAYNLTKLNAAFRHHADGSGVFESGQNPIIVGQAAYNSAYGTNFASSSWCNGPGSTLTTCDGLARISEQGGDLFGFNTLKTPNAKLSIKLEPKAIHDEMNAASFDEFGRMTANLGLEAVPATPAAQNIILYPFVNPPTELIDATNLPHADVKVTPIASADGTQIWKITHNGVDTHPIHFHLYDVQILNRVTWDNIIIPTDPGELGWKDTIRVSPLEDTIVAIRPIMPVVPFEIPNSIHPLDPGMPLGSTAAFNNIDAAGNPTNPIVNQLVNFGFEYMYHCHILSHEEMDMMRPVTVAVPPNKPDTLTYATSGTGNNAQLTLTWMDNSINETSFLIQRMDVPGTWTDLGTVQSPLDVANTHGLRSYIDTTYRLTGAYQYRVVGQNTIGYAGQFMGLTVTSVSDALLVGTAPAAPSVLTTALQAGQLTSALPGPQVRLAWTNNATNASFNQVERCAGTGCTNFSPIATVATTVKSYVDAAVGGPTQVSYTYRIVAVNPVGSAASNTATMTVPPVPPAPTSVTAVLTGTGPGNLRTVTVSWLTGVGTPAATTFTIQRATTAPGPTTVWATAATVNAPATSGRDTGAKPGMTYWYRVVANYTVNGVRISNPSTNLVTLAVP